MRLAAYLVLVTLAASAALSGDLFVAIALGGAKALVVGAEYMELRRAARLHAIAFALAVAALVTGLGAMTFGAT